MSRTKPAIERARSRSPGSADPANACPNPCQDSNAASRVARSCTLEPYGTFIHFDLESRSIAGDEIEFLPGTVPLFMKQLA
jgi:hypothetical protein